MIRKLDPEKRSQYLSAALKLFAAKGVQNTSTAAIARAAGTASGTLFLYFPTKQDLINELALQIGEQQSAYIESILDTSLPACQVFYQIWQGSIGWFLNHFDAYHYNQQVRHAGLIDPDIVQESQKSFGYYFQAIEKGLEEGAIKPYPVEIIGAFLYQGVVAVMELITAPVNNAQSDLSRQEELIQTGFTIFWDGIRAK